MKRTFALVSALALVYMAIAQSQAQGTDACENLTCLNGGTCTVTADNQTSCSCVQPFFGDTCQFSTDPCYKYGCINGGYCTAPADAPYCVCPDGFTGDKCESQIESQCANTTEVSEPVCSQECPEGYTCKFRPFPCKEGMSCIQIVVAQCVRTVDQCDQCQSGVQCKSTGIVCVTTPCPSFECIREPTEPVDSCGGCPDGQVCQPTGVVCIKAPCNGAFKCVDVTAPAPSVACNLFCIKGYECKLEVPRCSFWNRRNCSSRPVPRCVPKCPKPKNPRRHCPRWLKPRNTCTSDNSCRRNRNQRCCPSRCDWNVCTNVRYING